MKRMICLILTLLLLAGCAAQRRTGSSGTPSSDPPPTTTEPASETETASNPLVMLYGELYEFSPEKTAEVAFGDGTVFHPLTKIPGCEWPDEDWECNFDGENLQAVLYGGSWIILADGIQHPAELASGPIPPSTTAKPVIYLYPPRQTEVTVRLSYDGELTCTYPAYPDGWTVEAAPDGTLTDARGQTYNYLYWEGRTDTVYDFSRGFCVAGADTAAFLEDALARLGLTRREANEFLVYWLPRMEVNPYNLIAFQTDAYTDSARLTVTPAPDTVLRVFMAWQPLEAPVDLPAQPLTAPARQGFTLVEWGGCEIGR